MLYKAIHKALYANDFIFYFHISTNLKYYMVNIYFEVEFYKTGGINNSILRTTNAEHKYE